MVKPHYNPQKRINLLLQLIRFLKAQWRSQINMGSIGWYLGRKGLHSNLRLEMLRNLHLGERCFLIGNGPSLKKMDLRPLANEFTIGLNRIYLLFDEIGFNTNYLVCVNKLVVEQCAREIANTPCVKFISWNAHTLIPFTRETIFLRSLLHPHFSKNLPVGMWEGSTVTYVGMQVAHHLGFQQVVLIGVDHHYETKGPPNMEVISEGDDPNHFSTQYFGEGFRWQLPDFYRSEIAYRIAKLAFEQDKREIVDATVDGRLQIFRKVKYEDLIEV